MGKGALKNLNLGLFRKFVECTVEMPEFQNTGKKVSLASLVLPLVRRVNPALAFRHSPQYGTAGHRLIRKCPAMALPPPPCDSNI
jgi:hypothetical protein